MSTEPDDWNWWWSAWRDRITCGSCGAVMDLKSTCPVCATDYRNLAPTEHVVNGRVITLPPVFNGVPDWSSYVMLQLMYRDWLRPLGEDPNSPSALPETNRPSSRVVVVLIFWTYFETLMNWFYESATNELPKSVAADLLGRYSSIGARLDRLHRILFGTTYGDDLDQLGHTSVRQHLETVQRQRNAFAHGRPESIGDALVQNTVSSIPSFHEAWIQSFNLRCAKRR